MAILHFTSGLISHSFGLRYNIVSGENSFLSFLLPHLLVLKFIASLHLSKLNSVLQP